MKIVLSCLLFCVSIFAQEVSSGQVLVLRFEYLDRTKPVTFLDEILAPFPDPQAKKTSVVVLPIDYKAKVGSYTLNYFENGKQKSYKIEIKAKKYPQETLHVNPKKVKPPKKFENQIYAEYKQAMKIYKSSTQHVYWKKPFILPLHSKVTSAFGNARIYNGKLHGYHSGTDFRAKVGTVVKASNDGVVVLAKKRYYAGGSVIIDHGFGIYSCYYHLSKINVKVGQKVVQNETLGLSGQSGRVTGPHLHFGIRINNINVDPLVFISEINSLF